MGSIVKKMFISRLETEGVRFLDQDEKTIIVTIGELVLSFAFRDEKTVNIIGTNLFKYRKEKENEVLLYCNELNLSYRYVKFCMESRADQVCMCYDAIIQMDTCAGICFELLKIMTKIAFDEEEEFKKRELI